jgi:hypothetical protein
MKKILLFILICTFSVKPQTSSKITIGINLAGISDWMTEMPFVNLMHNARTWMTSNIAYVDGGQNKWDTGLIDSIPKDENGYPLSLPYFVEGAETLQVVHTIWASLAGWPEGIYTLLYDGEGDFAFSGNLVLLTKENGKITFQFNKPVNDNGIFIIKIVRSDSANHVRNMRFLMPGSEFTYQNMPYYSEWFNRLKPFKVIRFMDWGRANNWGHDNSWECYDDDNDTIKVDWKNRAKYSNYTWATNKGVPYEVMIDLCNRLNADMWVCVPYIASNDYITQLAELIKNQLNPSLKVYVEYSNENWNWMFGQTQWLNKFGCVRKGKIWPEGIVPYIQNCLDIFSQVFDGQLDRIIRVVGVQAAWLDVSKRIVFNMRNGSFDAFAPAAYFGLDENTDKILDSLGSNASISDLTTNVRRSRLQNEFTWLKQQKRTIGDSLNIPMIYYEGGQHLTPIPFGENPTYSQVLIDIQRDTSMYNLYMEWFKMLEDVTKGSNSLFMHYSFIAPRSAKYGSWGILESVNQDTSQIFAPKYKAILDYISYATSIERNNYNVPLNYFLSQNYPNPFNSSTTIPFSLPKTEHVTLKVFDVLGNEIEILLNGNAEAGKNEVVFEGKNLTPGIYYYILQIRSETRRGLMLKCE